MTRCTYLRIASMLSLMIVSSCVNRITMHSLDGVRLDGRWRLAREDSGLIEVVGSAGEPLVGTFKPVPRGSFFDGDHESLGTAPIVASAQTAHELYRVCDRMLGTR